MFAETVNHGQDNHGSVQDQDSQDMGQSIVQALRYSLWDAMLKIFLQIIIRDETISNGSSTILRITTANLYMLLNVMSAHTSLIRS